MNNFLGYDFNEVEWHAMRQWALGEIKNMESKIGPPSIHSHEDLIQTLAQLANFHDDVPFLSGADTATIVSRINELGDVGLDAAIAQAIRKPLPGRKNAVTTDVESAYREGALAVRLLNAILSDLHTAQTCHDLHSRVVLLVAARLHTPRTLIKNMVAVRGKTSTDLLTDIAASAQAAIQSAVLLGIVDLDRGLVAEPVAKLFGFVSATVKLLPEDARIVGGSYKFWHPGTGYLPSLAGHMGVLGTFDGSSSQYDPIITLAAKCLDPLRPPGARCLGRFYCFSVFSLLSLSYRFDDVDRARENARLFYSSLSRRNQPRIVPLLREYFTISDADLREIAGREALTVRADARHYIAHVFHTFTDAFLPSPLKCPPSEEAQRHVAELLIPLVHLTCELWRDMPLDIQRDRCIISQTLRIDVDLQDHHLWEGIDVPFFFERGLHMAVLYATGNYHREDGAELFYDYFVRVADHSLKFRALISNGPAPSLAALSKCLSLLASNHVTINPLVCFTFSLMPPTRTHSAFGRSFVASSILSGILDTALAGFRKVRFGKELLRSIRMIRFALRFLVPRSTATEPRELRLDYAAFKDDIKDARLAKGLLSFVVQNLPYFTSLTKEAWEKFAYYNAVFIKGGASDPDNNMDNVQTMQDLADLSLWVRRLLTGAIAEGGSAISRDQKKLNEVATNRGMPLPAKLKLVKSLRTRMQTTLADMRAVGGAWPGMRPAVGKIRGYLHSLDAYDSIRSKRPKPAPGPGAPPGQKGFGAQGIDEDELYMRGMEVLMGLGFTPPPGVEIPERLKTRGSAPREGGTAGPSGAARGGTGAAAGTGSGGSQSGGGAAKPPPPPTTTTTTPTTKKSEKATRSPFAFKF